MRYATAAAFRQALEERIRQQSVGNNQPLTRLRKMVAFDRFLARLARSDPGAWIIKGGFALQLRLGARARTTKDIDVAVTKDWGPEDVATRLRRAGGLDLLDWFEFEVGAPTEAATGAPRGGFRFPVRCLLDGRAFETFHLDVGLGDRFLDAPEKVAVPTILGFAGIASATVHCYPLAAQVAEKLHAYTRTYSSGGTSRARDLADILLTASFAKFSSSKLTRAIHVTFRSRHTHPVPKKMPEPPARLSASYRKLAREWNLPWPTITEAERAAVQFLDPILQGRADRLWDPARWKWRP